MVYSLVLTCRACNVEPYAYLHHVLTEMPQRASDADISDLLPFNFAKRVQLATPPPEAPRSGVQSAFSTSSGIGRSSVGNVRVFAIAPRAPARCNRDLG
jgi:hypothetical protein